MYSYYLVFIISLSLLPNILIANELVQPDKCQIQYKECISSLQDQVEEIAEENRTITEECADESNQYTVSNYQYVHCQDKFISCNGGRDSLWNRMHNTSDVSLDTENPEELGLEESDIQNIEKNAKAIKNLKSLLIAKNNSLIYEKYYLQKDDPKPHHVWSVTKSIVSLLIGIAIDKGVLESEELPIKPFFPEYYNGKHDIRKDSIAIKHLLTMTTAIKFTDDVNWHNMKDFLQFERDDNAYDWILSREMVLNYKPGDIFLYGSPNTDLLTSILSKSSDLTSLKFAEKYFFKPLEIENYVWAHDSQENYVGGYALHLRPRALIRIGQMLLDGGIYKENRIISENWINKSFSRQTETGGWSYGYLWWIYSVGGHKVISAIGHGGQQIVLVPALNLVVVTTSDSLVCDGTSVDEQLSTIIELAKLVILKFDE